MLVAIYHVAVTALVDFPTSAAENVTIGKSKPVNALMSTRLLARIERKTCGNIVFLICASKYRLNYPLLRNLRRSRR